MVVVVDYGDFDGHAVEVDHAIDHAGGLCCRNAWTDKEGVTGFICFATIVIMRSQRDKK